MEHSERFDVLDEEKIGEDPGWSDDRDPIPEGWEDWSDLEGSQNDELDSTDWSDLEWGRPNAVVGYRNRATVKEMGESIVDTFCDTGAATSKLLLQPGQWDSLGEYVVSADDSETEHIQVTICLGGRQQPVRLEVIESTEGPRVILGRDVLRLDWVVDVDLEANASFESSNQS